MSGEWSAADADARIARIARRLQEAPTHDFAGAAGVARELMVDLPELYRHSRRVAALARDIAAALGLSEAIMAEAELGGLLHDIGKLALPLELLQKPASLTADERALVRKHVDYGAHVAQAVPYLSGVADTILASHEWFDGSGYPAGLRGLAIPLGARVVSLADAFDVMTQRGLYRSPVSVEAALQEIERETGTHFDPELVPAALQALRDTDVSELHRLGA